MALFGVPVAHEDHARRGVLAALELQRRLKADVTEIDASSSGALRMALNTGLGDAERAIALLEQAIELLAGMSYSGRLVQGLARRGAPARG